MGIDVCKLYALVALLLALFVMSGVYFLIWFGLFTVAGWYALDAVFEYNKWEGMK